MALAVHHQRHGRDHRARRQRGTRTPTRAAPARGSMNSSSTRTWAFWPSTLDLDAVVGDGPVAADAALGTRGDEEAVGPRAPGAAAPRATRRATSEEATNGARRRRMGSLRWKRSYPVGQDPPAKVLHIPARRRPGLASEAPSGATAPSDASRDGVAPRSPGRGTADARSRGPTGPSGCRSHHHVQLRRRATRPARERPRTGPNERRASDARPASA